MTSARSVFVLAVCASIVGGICLPAAGLSVRPGFQSVVFPGNDDNSVGPIAIGFDCNFFGTTYTSLYVNNNGNVTFGQPLGTYTPFNLLTTSRVIIAPFFADVDTRAGNRSAYGQGTVDGRAAFGATWPGVGYYSFGTDKLNNFQLVIIDRSDVSAGDFDFEFNYDQIQWETGGASGGSGGLGGSSARAGYSNGSTEAYEIYGSAINGAFLDGGPYSLSSVGRYVFQVRNGAVAPQPPSDIVPEPLTLLGLGSALMGLTGYMRRRTT